jgi:hypothetical protein
LVGLATGRMAVHAAWARDDFRRFPKQARERVARSAISKNALGGRSSPRVWAAASPSKGIAPKPANKRAIEIFNIFWVHLDESESQISGRSGVPAGDGSGR